MVKDPFLEHRILTADPVQLIQMLYERALDSTRDARSSLAKGDIPARAGAITRTLAILGELEGSLDHSNGGSLSRNLSVLYQYMRRRLTEGNMQQKDAPLAEVESLLKTLGEGWSVIGPVRPAAPAAQPREAAYEMAAISAPSHFSYSSDLGSSAHSWTA